MFSRGWTIEAQEIYATGMDALYAIFKANGKLDDYNRRSEKWNKKKATEKAETVLKELEEFVGKCQAAADKKGGQP